MTTQLEPIRKSVDLQCSVEVEHSGWENLGDDAATTHEGYLNGWDPVLKLFVAATSE